jgi:3-phenylpropionate/trans-cinnamate dioxygenase ferredoxin reductase component
MSTLIATSTAALSEGAVADRFVIVGTGEAGVRAANSLRERGFRGSITLIGAESGVPYERPPLSKELMTNTAEPSPVTIGGAAGLEAHDVVVVTSAVLAVDRGDRTVLLADGRNEPFDALLLATGAHARTLAVEGGKYAHTLRTYADAIGLRTAFQPGVRVVLIGAGFIGLELAASARTRGCDVVVLEAAERPMGRAVPAEIADVITARHLAAGVDIRCNQLIESIERIDAGDDQRYRICFDDGDALECDVVVAGIGAAPNISLAVDAALEIFNGIAVDQSLRTSDPGIFAAGDCCSFPHPLFDDRRIRLEAWRNAQDQGAHAAGAMLGDATPFSAVPWFWSDHYELGLQIAGLPDAASHEVVRVRPDGATVRFGLDAAGRLVSASGVAEGTSIGRDIRLAERMIAGRLRPDMTALVDPLVTLKSLLATSGT